MKKAIAMTGELLERNPGDRDAAELRRQLIRSVISSGSMERISDPDDPAAVKRRKATLLLLYNRAMAKDDPAGALKALDAYEGNWPGSEAVARLRASAVRALEAGTGSGGPAAAATPGGG